LWIRNPSRTLFDYGNMIESFFHQKLQTDLIPNSA
jgi:hypothetical protein